MDKKRLERLYWLGRQLATPQFVWLVVRERLRLAPPRARR
jgi:hypothetical protein